MHYTYFVLPSHPPQQDTKSYSTPIYLIIVLEKEVAEEKYKRSSPTAQKRGKSMSMR